MEKVGTMQSNVPLIPLKKIGTLVKREALLSTAEKYRTIGCKLYGLGVYERETKLGGEIASKMFLVKEDDFLINRIWAQKGSAGIVPSKLDGAVVTNDFPVIKLDFEQVSPKYLAYYVQTQHFWDDCKKHSHGASGRERLAPKDLITIGIPLPPLKEQQRIVATLERLIAKIEIQHQQRTVANEFIKSLFISQLKKIQIECLERYPNKTIGEIFEITSGGTPSREISIYWNGDIAWVKSGELQDNDIFAAEEHITKEGLECSAAKLFPKETILIALYGQGQTRGRTARLMIEAATNQACCAILPKPEMVDSRFLQYWLRGLYHEMREKYRDGAQPNWNGKMIKAIKIALPLLSEQHHIVAHLDRLQAKVDEVKRLQKETEREMEALVPAVLAKAFGEGIQ